MSSCSVIRRNSFFPVLFFWSNCPWCPQIRPLLSHALDWSAHHPRHAEYPLSALRAYAVGLLPSPPYGCIDVPGAAHQSHGGSRDECGERHGTAEPHDGGLVCVAFYRDWKLATFAMLVLPLTSVLVIYLGRRLRQLSWRVQEKMGLLNAFLESV